MLLLVGVTDALRPEAPVRGAADLPDREERVHIVQLGRTGKGCLSQLAGAGDRAVVVDPSLDPKVYLGEAAARAGDTWDMVG